MKKQMSSIMLIIFILIILCFCSLIRNTVATEETISLYEQLMASTTVEEMYGIILNNQATANALTSDEINSLKLHAEEIYIQNGDPTNEYVDLTETLEYLAGELETEAAVLANWTGTVAAQTISTTQTINLTGNVTLSGKITVASGVTLTITGTDKTITRASTYTGALFEVSEGANLYITGGTANKSSIIIDGNENVISQASAIITRGNLYLTNTTVRNNKNRATSSAGGGMYIYATGSLEMNNCLITKNTACAFGGAFYSAGNIKITDSEISYNHAMTTATAEKSGLGRGGGFLLTGSTTYGLLTNVNIHHNVAMYYGGGMQVQTGAELYFDSGTISYNETVLHGAGAVHLTGAAKFTMDDGASITNNKARYTGGAIHTSYSCVLNLNGGEISGNTVIGRGGGVHINVGGELNLNGTNIMNNSANSGMRVSVSTVDDTGDTYTTPTSSSSDNEVEGYGGGVLVDSGTCLMYKGTVSGNFAAKGGAGIGFVMISVGDRTSEDNQNKIVSFTMEGGNITNNNTDGNGGGIYLMKNMLAEDTTDASGNVIPGVPGTPTITLNGGSVTNNTAKENGGAAYLEEETGFYITGDAILSENYANLDGGAVYVSEGEAVISGGTISKNYAQGNGGALYVKGTVTMSNATVTDNGNGVTEKGGAVYVTSGSFTMTSGTLSNNKAINGGAVYINEGDFLITSGEMTYNTASNEGGAVYAKGGSIVIGIEGCTDENNKHENPNTHPYITQNTAVYGGGGFMTDGVITNGIMTMYCGVLKDNSSNNEGTGNNIYMNGGTFNLDGGTVGEEINPGVVLVGGELNDTRDEENQGEEIIMVYHSCLDNHAIHEVSVTIGKYVNLPAAQKGWEKEGYTMVGWTTSEDIIVRTFDDYKSVGMAVKVEDTDDGQINYYAVWAKTPGIITYNLDGGIVTGTNQTTYDYSVTLKSINIISPVKSYYTFLGWELTASEDTVANWETENVKSVFYSVDHPESGLDLDIGTHFGDITLTAIYERDVSDIEIIVDNSVIKNQKLIFTISGTPNDETVFTPVKVIIACNEDGYGKAVIKGIPVGTYTINFQNNWNWRYGINEEEIQKATNITIENDEEKYTFNFESFNIKNKLWLNGYNYYGK